MGELDSDGSFKGKDQVGVFLHTREEKKSDCDCGSDKCGCDGSCPKSKNGKAVWDTLTSRQKRELLDFLIFAIIVWALVCLGSIMLFSWLYMNLP